MSKISRVARMEYLNIVRTKAFIFSVVLMPVFMGGSIAVQAFLGDQADLSDRTFAVVDRTGKVFPGLEAAARRRNTDFVYEEKDGEREQTKPRFVPVPAEDDAEALSDRVRTHEIFAYVIIDEGVMDGTAGGEIAYHSSTPNYGDLPRWLETTLNAQIRSLRFEAEGIDADVVKRVDPRVSLGRYGLVERSSEGSKPGEKSKAERVDKIATFVVPLACVMLLFMLVMLAAPALLNNVLEEKIQRISEILVASVSPFELFFGKLLGVVFVSWTLSGLYLGGIAFLAHHFDFSSSIPTSIYFWFLLFQLLALLIFGSVFSALGAACSEIRDAQSMMMPAMLILMLPLFVWTIVLEQPDSTFSTVLSLFPPATPFLMLLRLSVPPGPEAWEIIAAIVLTLAFTAGCIWVAGRIFRVGILSQGQTPGLLKLVRWAREG